MSKKLSKKKIKEELLYYNKFCSSEEARERLFNSSRYFPFSNFIKSSFLNSGHDFTIYKEALYICTIVWLKWFIKEKVK